MSNYRVFRLRRGAKTDLPSLSLGELGYCTDTKEVFVGNGVSNTLINPTSISLQNGLESISSSSSTVSVTLPSAYADTNYSITASVQNTTDATPSQFAIVITSKSTTGFTVTLSDDTDTANYKLSWITYSG